MIELSALKLETVVQLLIAGVNVYFIYGLKSLQTNNETTKYWKEKTEEKEQALKEKDEVINRILKKKNDLKYQYHNQLALTKKLEGELATYKKIHNHA